MKNNDQQEGAPTNLALRHQLIEDHIAYAKQLARRFYRRRAHIGIELEDFQSAAQLGLCDAARRYDPSTGVAFKSFCYLRVQGSMMDLVRYHSEIPRSQFYYLTRHRNRSEKPEAEEHFPYFLTSSIRELSSFSDILDALGMVIHPGYEQERVELCYANGYSPEIHVYTKSEYGLLRKLICGLTANEREMLILRYFANLSYKEIAEVFGGMSKSWLSRLHNRAIDSLRERIVELNMESRQRLEHYQFEAAERVA